MSKERIGNPLIDRGGRRKIKDRRFRINIKQVPEQRTDLQRRCGSDRRFKQVLLDKGISYEFRRGDFSSEHNQ